MSTAKSILTKPLLLLFHLLRIHPFLATGQLPLFQWNLLIAIVMTSFDLPLGFSSCTFTRATLHHPSCDLVLLLSVPSRDQTPLQTLRAVGMVGGTHV